MTSEPAITIGFCPTCGPTQTEPHPRLPNVTRCSNCKERQTSRRETIAEVLDLIRDDNRYRAWLASLRMPGMLPSYEDIDREMIATYLRDTLGEDDRA
jgi:hypothetical protein